MKTTIPAPPYPATKQHLVGSKWSRTNTACALRHFEVRRVAADGEVELFSVLDPEVVEHIDWRTLRDREKWLPGWVNFPNPE
jgi:tryptophan-rich hypothetical protein